MNNNYYLKSFIIDNSIIFEYDLKWYKSIQTQDRDYIFEYMGLNLNTNKIRIENAQFYLYYRKSLYNRDKSNDTINRLYRTQINLEKIYKIKSELLSEIKEVEEIKEEVSKEAVKKIEYQQYVRKICNENIGGTTEEDIDLVNLLK